MDFFEETTLTIYTTLATALLFAATGGCASTMPDAKTTSLRAQSGQQWTEICKDWDDWDKPGPPFQIYGNTYYVGTCGIGAVLVTGDDGHFVIDSGTQAGASVVAANIEALGFEVSDVRILLHSHEHFDHVGGLSKLQRLSGADVYASTVAEPVLATGKDAPSDPQFGLHDPFPAVSVDRVVQDGETVQLGALKLTAIATPGHTPGALSWQWESCDGQRCESVVYADSLSPVSRDDYRFSDHPAYLTAYRRGLNSLSQLTCTILVTPHPSASGMRDRLVNGGLTDSEGCVRYADAVASRLEKRLQKERDAGADDVR